MIMVVPGTGIGMITDGIGNGSGSSGSASDSAIGGNGDATNDLIVTGTTID